jgi:hypothetical protein
MMVCTYARRMLGMCVHEEEVQHCNTLFSTLDARQTLADFWCVLCCHLAG